LEQLEPVVQRFRGKHEDSSIDAAGLGMMIARLLEFMETFLGKNVSIILLLHASTDGGGASGGLCWRAVVHELSQQLKDVSVWSDAMFCPAV
jgi:hypothetical protein